ncbi:MAG: dTDP-4-dehydrorhamnose 3,5-epimerase family protein [Gemmatimonadota bacterium]
MIHDVRVKQLKPLTDGRGFLMEMLREDDPLFQRFGQVYMTGCRRGMAKAWHYHREQTDHFVCVAGRALLVLCDLRQDSPSRGSAQEFVLEAPPGRSTPPLLVQIPPFVVHGFTALECDEARIVNVPTLPYRYDDPDEHRYPWDSPDVPYRWPDFVGGGG